MRYAVRNGPLDGRCELVSADGRVSDTRHVNRHRGARHMIGILIAVLLAALVYALCLALGLPGDRRHHRRGARAPQRHRHRAATATAVAGCSSRRRSAGTHDPPACSKPGSRRASSRLSAQPQRKPAPRAQPAGAGWPAGRAAGRWHESPPARCRSARRGSRVWRFSLSPRWPLFLQGVARKRPNRQDLLFERARAVCEAHKPAGAGNPSFFPSTAGEVGRSLRAVGGDPAPWESLPKDHFVARCSYPASGFDPNSIKTCPDGQNYDLRRPTQTDIDEEGRTATNLAGAPAIEPC